ncbi:MAG: hypothetical protein EBV15_01775 [Bacteroidetes bacterium]|nr:hypothetical protein [Bacteroidota bacterium]
MQRIKPAYGFWLIWIFLSAYLGVFKALPKSPESVHQGAQCDRACVAWNYYHESMNFFMPRVSEDRQSEGVTGMEFPVIPYSAALLYKIFGPHDFIYRFLMYVLVSLGVFHAWKITGLFIQQNIHRLLLVFGWYCSPVLVFYTPNFLADSGAMAFVMMAWYYLLLRIYGVEPDRNLRRYSLWMSLAGLLKISFLIYGIAGFMLLYLWRFFKNQPLQVIFTRRDFWWMLVPAIPVSAWYGYSGWLTRKTSNMHFLQSMNPAESIKELIQNSQTAINNWQESLYRPGFFVYFMIVLLILLVLRLRDALLPGLAAILMISGFGAIWILFNRQFLYHDYYFILFFPALFFGWLFLQQLFQEQRQVFLGCASIGMGVAFWVIPFMNAGHAAHMMNRRYATGDYYHQNAFPETEELVAQSDTLKKVIPEGARIFYAFDNTPNTALYLMKKRGVRISKDFGPEITADILSKSRAKFLVLNDTALWFSHYEPRLKTGARAVYHQKNTHVYRLP